VRAGEPSSEHQLRLRSTKGPDVPVKVIARAAPFEGGTAVVLGIRNVPAASS